MISIIIFPLIPDASRSEPAEPIPLLAAAPCPEPIVCPVCPALPVPLPPVATPSPAPASVAAVPETPPADPAPVDCPVCPPIPDPVPCLAPDPALPTATYQLPHLDLVIALDITSSMGPQVAAFKTEVGQLSDLLSPMAPSFAIGLLHQGASVPPCGRGR